MFLPRLVRIGWLASALCWALQPSAVRAASFPEFVDPHPAPGNQFGAAVVPLASGNVVITSPGDDALASNGGAVYLFNGATGVLISTLQGSHPDDAVGSSGVTALANGNFVVSSPGWNNGGILDAGAVTWGSGTTGIDGVVSAANSLVGSTASDFVGFDGVTALSNGNYVVRSSGWDNGAVNNAGAATWCNGTTGRIGAVSAANSLVGSRSSDQVGLFGVTPLSNGNYVVPSPYWDTGAVTDAGAATWCDGLTGRVGIITSANSLVGSAASDQVGLGGVTALTNGNYVVKSRLWNNGGAVDAGAATWGNGATGITGAVSAANSLVSSSGNDQVGSGGVTALSNGNYVVSSPLWNNVSIIVADAGAATWGDGATGVTGAVSPVNSLVGSSTSDQVSSSGVTALANGNYVVASQLWNNGGIVDAGAATWGYGVTGSTGALSSANSLVGSTASDFVGSGGVAALSNGNYVIPSPSWSNGAIVDAGAATWGDGAIGITGAVSSTNSLVGSTANDAVAGSGVTALANGNYVVRSPNWNNAATADAGAATWGDGTIGATGVITAANSLVGSTANDRVGLAVTALMNGNYVVQSSTWDGAAPDVGAVTWGNGTTGVTGVISAANSLVSSKLNDQVGSSGVTALSDGNYVVTSPIWDNGVFVDAGAATWGDGTTGVTGTISAGNSFVAGAANTGLVLAIADTVNGNFICPFRTEEGGRIRVGPATPFELVSALDIPGDQGGWLRLTFLRHYLDHVNGSPAVSTYGVWRHVPGTMPSFARMATVDAKLGASPDARAIERLRSVLPPDLDLREAAGRLFATIPASRPAGTAATLPPGTWELVSSVPAVQQNQYVVAVPTISNAAANDFVVTAHTTTPALWFITDPISGQSVDNLAPAQPTQFTAAYANDQTHLQWAPNSEFDLGSYSLHRGSSAEFTPTIENRIASQTGTSHADVGPAGSYYKLCAVDVNGNQSTFALVTPEQTADVDDGAPVTFAFHGVRPNPAYGGDLHVSFALPSGEPARLELLDVSGRVILVREVGALGVGRHALNLAEGRRVRTGIYWVRLTQGRNRGTARAAVIE